MGHEKPIDDAWPDGVNRGRDQIEIRDLVRRTIAGRSVKCQMHRHAAGDRNVSSRNMRQQPTEAVR
jgi:hypothetical protein